MVEVWEDVIRRFLVGEMDLPEPFDQWFYSFRPKSDDPVVRSAIPEPYLGPLGHGSPRGICLALNPGDAHVGIGQRPDFQSRSGIFARDVKQAGSYRAWAATWPYLDKTWTSEMGPNRHHQNRLTFLQRWHDDPSITANENGRLRAVSMALERRDGCDEA
jgi:hypothetical protein